MEFITALPTPISRALKNSNQAQFQATVTETTWNMQRRRKQTHNTKKLFWINNVTGQAFNK
ncbi:hypothetical protein [Vibrio parahaemolyticus]|uniref:hypothetical protein n=1 Tax=Vibrio parahaemolyticus TaxID=670 RepID=UPI001F4FD025|nr:hypothetical protein [Vibrio parahaemolyticus]HCM0862596.1 hypothetical protein [Vibrio parahaemolyticus]